MADASARRRGGRGAPSTAAPPAVAPPGAGPSSFSYGVDPDGRVSWMSEDVAAVLGWQPDELIGRLALELVHPDDVTRGTAARAAMLRDGSSADAVIRTLRKDGGYTWLSLDSVPDLDASGRVVGSTVMAHALLGVEDMTPVLAEAESRYRMLALNTFDVVAHQVDGVLEWISPSVQTLLGYTAHELVGTRTIGLWHPDDVEGVSGLRDRALAGANGEGLFRARHKDGTYRWLDVAAASDRSAPRPGIVVSLRDATARVAAEEELRAREAEYRLLAENAVDVVLRTDLDAIITWVSPSVFGVLGWEPHEVVGRPVTDLLHPDDRARRDAVRAEVLVGYNAELLARYRHKRGGYRWLGVTGGRLTDDDGTVVGLVGSARDATAEVEAREALEEREREYRLLAENSADLVVRVDLEGRYTYVSPASRRLLGREPESMLGRHSDEFVHPDDRAARLDAVQAMRETGDSGTFDARFERADGSYVWLEVTGSPVHDESGTLVGTVGSARDVDAVVKAREALEEREREYRLLAENAVDMVVRSDLDGHVVWVSPSCERMLGWSPDELVGRDFAALMHPDDRDERDRVRALMASGSAGEMLARYRHKDGRYVWLGVTGGPVTDDDGRVAGVVGSARDATAEVEARLALEASERAYRLLAENAGDTVARTSLDGVVEWMSPSCVRIFGWTAEEMVGLRMTDLVHPDDLARRLATTIDDPEAPTYFEGRYRCKGGEYRWLGVSLRPVHEHGELVARIGVARDIGREVEARALLDERDDQYRMLAENAADIVFRSDPTGAWQYLSPSIEALLGYPAESLLGRRVGDLMHPDDLPALQAAVAQVESGERVTYEGRLRRADGSYVWMQMSVRPVVDDQGRVIGRVGNARDVTREVESLRALEASEEMFRRVMAESNIGMAVIALDGTFLVVNQALCRLLGRDEAWLLQHSTVDVVHPSFREVARSFLAQARSGVDDVEPRILRMRKGDHGDTWARRTAVLVRDEAGHPAYLVAQMEDLSAERAAQDQLAYQAFHDPLTGLRNRSWVIEMLEEELRSTDPARSAVGVLFLDLDNMKLVNDSLGHGAGDRVILEMGRRIGRVLRPGDHLGRFGGDEFVVVVPHVADPNAVERLAERLLEAVSEPFEVDGHRLVPSVSIGIVVSQAGATASSLLRDADSALSRAKSSGRARWHFFDDRMHADAIARLTMEDELRRAVAGDELVVHYQPIVLLADRRIVGHEALVRWQHPTRGLVPPLEFLPVAEESGLIVDVGHVVLDKVCALLASRPDLPGPISVNKSPLQIARRGWRTRFLDTVSAHGVDPRRLVVEVTETAALALADDARGDLEAVRALGVGVHVDDFGTGYSSISLLRDLPVTGLKLDASFTRRLTGGEEPADVLAAGLAGLARGLHLTSVAEGIETEEQADYLVAQGWTHGQGWLFGRPQPDPLVG